MNGHETAEMLSLIGGFGGRGHQTGALGGALGILNVVKGIVGMLIHGHASFLLRL